MKTQIAQYSLRLPYLQTRTKEKLKSAAMCMQAALGLGMSGYACVQMTLEDARKKKLRASSTTTESNLNNGQSSSYH